MKLRFFIFLNFLSILWVKAANSDSATNTRIHVNQTDTFPYILSKASAGIYTVVADNKVSMTVVSYSKSSYSDFLRNVSIYDGHDINSTLVGTAYDLYTQNNQYISLKHHLVVQIPSSEKSTDYPMFIFQDYEHTKTFVKLQSVACKKGEHCGVFQMDASKGPVAIQTAADNYEEADVLMSFDGMGTLEVYGGVASDPNAISIYNAATSAPFLPQKFTAPYKIYVLLNGKGSVTISRNDNDFGLTKAFGRKGIIQSTLMFPESDWQQGDGEILAPLGYTDAKFKLKVMYADIKEDETFFRIAGSKNGVTTFEAVFNTTYLPDLKNAYVVTGDTLSVYYYSPIDGTKGMFSRFEVDQP